MFDSTKTYANKKGLVAAIRKSGADPKTVEMHQAADGRWFAVEPVAVVEAPAVEFDLTDNEFHAAMILVKNDCLNGMGGERPSDLDNDPYTWVYADTLVMFGWSKESAAGTFAALDAKGVINADGRESTISTAAYRWLDTKWDEHKGLASTAKTEQAPAEPVAAPAGKVTMPTQNGVKHPRLGGLCAQAWAMFEQLGPGVDVKAALAEGAKRGFNDNNIRTELCRWRKFHGINARAK